MKVTDIDKVLAKYDLEGLIECGAPCDEYETEAKLIHKMVSGSKPRSISSDLINEVFSYYFNYHDTKNRYPQHKLDLITSELM